MSEVPDQAKPQEPQSAGKIHAWDAVTKDFVDDVDKVIARAYSQEIIAVRENVQSSLVELDQRIDVPKEMAAHHGPNLSIHEYLETVAELRKLVSTNHYFELYLQLCKLAGTAHTEENTQVLWSLYCKYDKQSREKVRSVYKDREKFSKEQQLFRLAMPNEFDSHVQNLAFGTLQIIDTIGKLRLEMLGASRDVIMGLFLGTNAESALKSASGKKRRMV